MLESQPDQARPSKIEKRALERLIINRPFMRAGCLFPARLARHLCTSCKNLAQRYYSLLPPKKAERLENHFTSPTYGLHRRWR